MISFLISFPRADNILQAYLPPSVQLRKVQVEVSAKKVKVLIIKSFSTKMFQ